MTAEEKTEIYNLLKLSSSYFYGYASPKFEGDDICFDDDVIEYDEPEIQEPKSTVNQKEQAEPVASMVSMEADESFRAAHQETEQSAQEGTSQMQNPVHNPDEPTQETQSGISLDTIRSRISSCRNCILANTRTNTVPGEGCETPYVMVIGEGPGEDEDKSGRPFVGKAGQLLDKMLAAIGLGRTANCYIANIVKCRPPMNRTPMPDEANACAGYLQVQIHILKPKFILAMGRTAVQNLLKTSTGINALRGQWMEVQFGSEKIPLMATYHPSALLRDERLKAPAWEDLKKFRQRLLAEKPDYAEVFYSQQNHSRF